jgi:hypothetical protein
MVETKAIEFRFLSGHRLHLSVSRCRTSVILAQGVVPGKPSRAPSHKVLADIEKIGPFMRDFVFANRNGHRICDFKSTYAHVVSFPEVETTVNC